MADLVPASPRCTRTPSPLVLASASMWSASPRGTNGPFVQPLGIERPLFQSGDLGFYECGAILEILRATLSPDIELSLVGRQRGHMPLTLVRRRRIAAGRPGQRTVEVILGVFQ